MPGLAAVSDEMDAEWQRTHAYAIGLQLGVGYQSAVESGSAIRLTLTGLGMRAVKRSRSAVSGMLRVRPLRSHVTNDCLNPIGIVLQTLHPEGDLAQFAAVHDIATRCCVVDSQCVPRTRCQCALRM